VQGKSENLSDTDLLTGSVKLGFAL